MCPLIHLATTFAYSPCVRRACVTPRIQSSPPCVRPPRPCARFRQPRIPLLFQEKNGAPVARGYEHPSPVIPRPVRINCILFEKPFSFFSLFMFIFLNLCGSFRLCVSLFLSCLFLSLAFYFCVWLCCSLSLLGLCQVSRHAFPNCHFIPSLAITRMTHPA